MTQVARACKAEGNQCASKILQIQPRLNVYYNTARRHNPFVTVLGFDDTLGLNTVPYPMNNYQPATEYHNARSQSLTNAKASQAKQANLHQTLEPQYKVEDKV